MVRRWCFWAGRTAPPNNGLLLDSPENISSEICDEDQMMIKFKEGVDEANKFNDNNVVSSSNNGSLSKYENSVEGVVEESIKQDPTLRTKENDLILLSSMGAGAEQLRMMRNTLRHETSSEDKLKDKEEVIDLTTLLVTCAQAVEADDTRNASELLRQIRQHASPFGDGSQRLAHCFANGLEARLAGTGSQIHRGLVSKKTSAADYIKAYYLYNASSPFINVSNFASNRTIMDMAKNTARIHIIDFGIIYGFQWPTFIQRISQRKGGPPHVRLTGIEFPQPGFRPAERIEETGKMFHLSMPPLQRDGKIARNMVLDLIKTISPNIFIHGILNGSYNAPFFVTRFREALFHFSALFDMLETNIPRERSERMLLEGELFGREALNVIACEGWERIERPETYKQWHARNLRAGFVSVPFSREIIKLAQEKVGLYHKDFMIDEDNHWVLQGWKGRIIYAISCWKPAT
ncbi:scarecrow-like protein 9 [Tanacetum coccineum]